MIELTHAKVLNGLTCVPFTPQQDRVGTSRCPQGKLVQSQGLSASIKNALFCSSREAESGDREFGDLSQTDIICDCANLNNDF